MLRGHGETKTVDEHWAVSLEDDGRQEPTGAAAAGAQNAGHASGDALNGGQCSRQVFAGDFSDVVSLHVDEDHVAQP